MSLIDETYFIYGDCLIPNVNDTGGAGTAIKNAVLALIAKKQPAFLKLVMGDDLYDAYILAPTEARFVSLLAELIDSTNKISPFADYVWTYWMKTRQVISTESGDKKTTGGGMESSFNLEKQCENWNNMVDACEIVYDWMVTNVADYPEWDQGFRSEKINPFDL